MVFILPTSFYFLPLLSLVTILWLHPVCSLVSTLLHLTLLGLSLTRWIEKGVNNDKFLEYVSLNLEITRLESLLPTRRDLLKLPVLWHILDHNGDHSPFEGVLN